MKKSTLIIAVALLASCASPNADKAPLGYDKTLGIVNVTQEDSNMNDAIEHAKRTLNEFDQALTSKRPAFSDFSIKKRFETPDDNGEHMWLTDIELQNDQYRGVINNDAEYTKEVKFGDTVWVKKSEVTDWMYLDKNVLKGGFTIRALRNKLNDAERTQLDRDLGFIIEEK